MRLADPDRPAWLARTFAGQVSAHDKLSDSEETRRWKALL